MRAKPKMKPKKSKIDLLERLCIGSVYKLLKSPSKRRKIGYTNQEILLRVNKSEQAIEREVKNLLKRKKIEAILIFIDPGDPKNYLLIYRLI
jgi:hypothetical protein